MFFFSCCFAIIFCNKLAKASSASIVISNTCMYITNSSPANAQGNLTAALCSNILLGNEPVEGLFIAMSVYP